MAFLYIDTECLPFRSELSITLYSILYNPQFYVQIHLVQFFVNDLTELLILERYNESNVLQFAPNVSFLIELKKDYLNLAFRPIPGYSFSLNSGNSLGVCYSISVLGPSLIVNFGDEDLILVLSISQDSNIIFDFGVIDLILVFETVPVQFLDSQVIITSFEGDLFLVLLLMFYSFKKV
ncbi:MAG: hypothetical protein EZS28_014709 [Streblomastix strix]|uniref:Uncharacterized protein n=1 Tax=Streblomastix strix TaxID=222440 RepID=A0A5J4W4Z0_9EUKA|nr:MAG: hypothetical protein EZS28_014709 [Streblomastix strix]